MGKKIKGIILLLAGSFLFSACGTARDKALTAKEGTDSEIAIHESQPGQEEQSTADIPKKDEAYYMIIKNDIQNYQITLMDLSSMEQACYEYTDGTEFFDKYGNDTPRQEFSEGKLAVIRRVNSNDTLGAIAFTDGTWDYGQVRNYSIDTASGRMDIADTSYQLDVNFKVFSEGALAEAAAIGENDVLNVYGIGRKVYSAVIETGHGTLALTNTELFEGGWVNLGTKVYSTITKDMVMDLPEGVYEFSVANDGYGDTGEVLIRRGMTTTIDLNDYKGEGPKLCKVTFDVGVKGAVLTVDGKKVRHSKPLELRYGVHTLGVYAQGYDAWSKQLVINSPTAKIDILLSEDTGGQQEAGTSSKESSGASSGSGDANSKNTASSGRKSGSKAGSRAGSYTSDGSAGGGSTDNSASSALANAALGSSLANIITGGDSTDYLDNLSDLVESLDKLNRKPSDNPDSN